MLAERALQMLFIAVICFVTDGLAIAVDHAVGGALVWLPIAITVLGMVLIAAGAGAMVAECSLAARQIRTELASLRRT